MYVRDGDAGKKIENRWVFGLQRCPSSSMSDPKDQTTIVPHSQQPLVTKTYPSLDELERVIVSSADVQKQWAKVPLSDRIAIANKFVVSAGARLTSPVALNVLCRFQG